MKKNVMFDHIFTKIVFYRYKSRKSLWRVTIVFNKVTEDKKKINRDL